MQKSESTWDKKFYDKSPPIQRIVLLRRLMLVHSYLYYALDSPIVDDFKWQSWANELCSLQNHYKPKLNFYDEMFHDWDASTGYHLKYDEGVINVATKLLRYCEALEAR